MRSLIDLQVKNQIGSLLFEAQGRRWVWGYKPERTVWMLFKAVGMDEITLGLSIEREEKHPGLRSQTPSGFKARERRGSQQKEN